MAKSAVDTAKLLMKRRKFASAITLLESRREYYEDDFDYFVTLGTACLYIGDTGNAWNYFQQAREIKINDSNLLLGQAAIFLRRGDTNRAIQYYLDVLDIEPGNSRAQAAMEFIRKNGEYSKIIEAVESGYLSRFFPPVGMNPDIIIRSVFTGLFIGALISLFIVFTPAKNKEINIVGPRANLESLVLTDDERKSPQESDLSNIVVHYLLDSKEINRSYENALQYFQEHRDNAAQVEINRLLNSNASLSIKQKAQILMTYLDEPTFDSLKDNYTYAQVADDPLLYLDCYVIWSGRISDARTYENGTWSCDLLVGYEEMRHIDGIVRVSFDSRISQAPDGDKPVRFLAKLDVEDSKIVLKGRASYQPLKGSVLPKF